MKLYRVTLTKELTVYVRAVTHTDAEECARREEHQMFSDCLAGEADVWADSRPVVKMDGLWDWDPEAFVYGDHEGDDITAADAVKESAEEVEREKAAPLPFGEPPTRAGEEGK